MSQALELARVASNLGEVPVGAVVVNSKDGKLVASAINRIQTKCDPTAHAEILAIRDAALNLKSPKLQYCDIYVTLEPCAMCAQAISLARIRRLYFAASDTKGGAVENGARIFTHSTCNHRPEVYSGIGELESAKMLKEFFKSLREKRSTSY